jgi:hypothetical protein
MSDEKLSDPYNGELPSDADIDPTPTEDTRAEDTPAEDSDAVDDVAGAVHGDARGLRVEGEAPLP